MHRTRAEGQNAIRLHTHVCTTHPPTHEARRGEVRTDDEPAGVEESPELLGRRAHGVHHQQFWEEEEEEEDNAGRREFMSQSGEEGGKRRRRYLSRRRPTCAFYKIGEECRACPA